MSNESKTYYTFDRGHETKICTRLKHIIGKIGTSRNLVVYLGSNNSGEIYKMCKLKYGMNFNMIYIYKPYMIHSRNKSIRNFEENEYHIPFDLPDYSTIKMSDENTNLLQLALTKQLITGESAETITVKCIPLSREKKYSKTLYKITNDDYKEIVSDYNNMIFMQILCSFMVETLSMGKNVDLINGYIFNTGLNIYPDEYNGKNMECVLHYNCVTNIYYNKMLYFIPLIKKMTQLSSRFSLFSEDIDNTEQIINIFNHIGF
jgi:hypothetical protein